MGADEFYERDLATKIKSSYQAVVTSRNLESDALAAQHLRFGSSPLYLIC